MYSFFIINYKHGISNKKRCLHYKILYLRVIIPISVVFLHHILLVFSHFLFGYHEIAYPILAVQIKEEGRRRTRKNTHDINSANFCHFQTSRTTILKMTNESWFRLKCLCYFLFSNFHNLSTFPCFCFARRNASL